MLTRASMTSRSIGLATKSFAPVKSLHNDPLRVVHGGDDNWQFCLIELGPQLGQDSESVRAGRNEIEQQEIDFLVECKLDRFRPRRCFHGRIAAALERVQQLNARRLIAAHYQDATDP